MFGSALKCSISPTRPTPSRARASVRSASGLGAVWETAKSDMRVDERVMERCPSTEVERLPPARVGAHRAQMLRLRGCRAHDTVSA